MSLFFSLQLNKILSCLCIFLLIYPSLSRCLGLLVLAYKQYISKRGCAYVLWSCYLRVLCGFRGPVEILSLASEKAPSDFRMAMPVYRQRLRIFFTFSSICCLSDNSQVDWVKSQAVFICISLKGRNIKHYFEYLLTLWFCLKIVVCVYREMCMCVCHAPPTEVSVWRPEVDADDICYQSAPFVDIMPLTELGAHQLA